MTYQRLSAHDRAFLDVEEPNTPMHVGGAFLFEGGPLMRPEGGVDIDSVRDRIASRLHLIPRYRQKIASIPLENHPIWVDDGSFNLHYHVRHTALPAPGDERQLKRLCARILSQHLDASKPLWEIWIVEGLEHDRVALVSKVHHCMIDGISGVDLLQVLLSTTPEKKVERGPEFFPNAVPAATTLVGDALRRRLRQPFELAGRLARAVSDPAGLARGAGEVMGGLRANFSVALQPALDTPLNLPVGPHRRFDWLGFELEEVKAIKNRLGGTVNDVVLATVTGAVGKFLEQRGMSRQKQGEIEYRAICPVSVRSDDERGALGNRVASMIATLPIAETDPVRCMKQVSETMAGVKESRQALGAEVLTSVSEWTAPTLMTLATRLAFSHRTSNLVVTNVPGPQVPLYLLGARMVETYPMAPLFHTQALSVALFSYSGALFWGFNADWDLVPDLHDFVVAIDDSFHSLCAAAAAA